MSRQTKQERPALALPRGFRAAGVCAGIKNTERKDMALLVSDVPAAVAGTFTTNQVQAASVKLCRARLAGGKASAVVVNSGNANACTGAQGVRDAAQMAELTAQELGVEAGSVFVCSTGHIGRPLPMDTIEAGIRSLAAGVSPAGGMDAAEAIMTTDTKPKHCSVDLEVDGKPVKVVGMAKGAGMIEPNMATMLAFLLTDAAIERPTLQVCLNNAVNRSFNRITVDGDRSTNDTVLLLANGTAGNQALHAGHPDWTEFCEAVGKMTLDLALKIVADGEGVTKQVTIHVKGAGTDAEADIAARAVANSLLVKTSWAGKHANWGRVMDALGYSNAEVAEEKVDIDYDDVPAVRGGLAAGSTPADLQAVIARARFTIAINLHLGAGEAVVYTCDCTEEYVRINM